MRRFLSTVLALIVVAAIASGLYFVVLSRSPSVTPARAAALACKDFRAFNEASSQGGSAPSTDLAGAIFYGAQSTIPDLRAGARTAKGALKETSLVKVNDELDLAGSQFLAGCRGIASG